MDKCNPVSIERTGVRREKAEEARRAYQTPEVLAAGAAIKLVQGPIGGIYRDLVNSGWNYSPQL